MVFAASKALAGYVSEEELASNRLYPPLTKIRDISAQIAAAVIMTAVADGVAKAPKVAQKTKDELVQFVKESMFDPRY